jgi:hypothetical protein
MQAFIKRIKHLVQFLYTMYSEHYERIYQKVSIIKTMVLLIKTTNIVLYRNFYKELMIHFYISVDLRFVFELNTLKILRNNVD